MTEEGFLPRRQRLRSLPRRPLFHMVNIIHTAVLIHPLLPTTHTLQLVSEPYGHWYIIQLNDRTFSKHAFSVDRQFVNWRSDVKRNPALLFTDVPRRERYRVDHAGNPAGGGDYAERRPTRLLHCGGGAIVWGSASSGIPNRSVWTGRIAAIRKWACRGSCKEGGGKFTTISSLQQFFSTTNTNAEQDKCMHTFCRQSG